jgi:rubrerythrin
VLQYALSRERLAMEQYRALAEATEPGEVKELFQWLADEEIEHKSELEKRYYALVHRGGGV